jgi:hypothetical protein
MKVSVGRPVALIAVLAMVAPVLAHRTDPGPAAQSGRPFLGTRLITPLLSTDLDHAGTWICSAVNAGNDPLTVTVRAFNQNGQEVSFDDHTCALEPGKTCTRFWETGIAGHYCTFTFLGTANAIRAGLQVSAADGFTLFAEAH